MCEGRVTVAIYLPFMSNHEIISFLLLILLKSRKADVGLSNYSLKQNKIQSNYFVWQFMIEFYSKIMIIIARYQVTIKYIFSVSNNVSIAHLVSKILYFSVEITYYLSVVIKLTI